MSLCRPIIVLLALLVCYTPPAASVVVPANFTGRLDAFIRCLMSDRSPLPVNLRTPELAIAVVANNQLLFSAGYGNTSSGAPITPDTLFGIGSISKAFTSTAAGMLAEQGRLRLSEPISRRAKLHTYDAYIDHQASLRDLFTHHTGLSRNDFIAIFHSTDVDWRDMIAQYVPRLEPALPFRYGYLYNNWMIAQAALAIEASVDLLWSDYISSLLLQPLGMANTTTSYRQSLSRNRATPYTSGPSSGVPPVELPVEADAWVDLMAPAGAVHSSANDMSKWLLFHLGSHPRLINQSTLDFLHSAEVTSTDPTTPFEQRGYLTPNHPALAANTSVVTVGYGYNWEEHVWNGHAAIEHSGGLLGFISDLWFFPIDGFGWWIGVPAVSNSYLNLLALWIAADMLGDYNIVDTVCRAQVSAEENAGRWGEVQGTLEPLFDHWNERRQTHSFTPPTHFTDTASTASPLRETSGSTAQTAVDPSHLTGTYSDLIGPFGVINVTLNDNITYPLLLTWEAAHMLLTPTGDPYPNHYSALVTAPAGVALVFPQLTGVAEFDVSDDGIVSGLYFYLGSPVPYLTASSRIPKQHCLLLFVVVDGWQ